MACHANTTLVSPVYGITVYPDILVAGSACSISDTPSAVTLSIESSSSSSYTCVWDQDGVWSTEGCSTDPDTGTCTCSHLTDFALAYYSTRDTLDPGSSSSLSSSGPSSWAYGMAAVFLSVVLFSGYIPTV